MTQNISWQTESVRLSLLGCADVSGKFTFLALTGKQPESVTSRPAQQIHSEEGIWEGGQLVISSQPGRMDITLNALPSDPAAMPTLGEAQGVVQRFDKALANMAFPQSVRLAAGVKLNLYPDDLAHSTRMLKSFLPQMDFGDATDIILQLNTPKKFPKLSGLVMNRLTKWSQLVAHTVQFSDNTALSNFQMQLLQLECDFNTSPTSKLPHHDSYKSIISALFSEIVGVATVTTATHEVG